MTQPDQTPTLVRNLRQPGESLKSATLAPAGRHSVTVVAKDHLHNSHHPAVAVLMSVSPINTEQPTTSRGAPLHTTPLHSPTQPANSEHSQHPPPMVQPSPKLSGKVVRSSKDVAEHGGKKYARKSVDGMESQLQQDQMRLRIHSRSSSTSGTKSPRGASQRKASTSSEPLPTSASKNRTGTANSRRRSGQDLISFHRESCRLFQSLGVSPSTEQLAPIKYTDSPSSSPISQHTSSMGVDATSSRRPESLRFNPSPTTQADPFCRQPNSHQSSPGASMQTLPEIEEDIRPLEPKSTPAMTWTSVETRRREYKKIDRAHSGLRGMWKKVMPKWCHGSCGRKAFFEGKCDGGSVRRFRMDLPDDEKQGR